MNQGEDISILALIQKNHRDMTKTQKLIGEYILKQPSSVLKMSISQLAEEIGIKSESTIVRFYRVLGFSGYHEFKVTLATEIAGNTIMPSFDIESTDTIENIKNKVFTGAINTLSINQKMMQPAILDNAIDLLFNSKRIILMGYGTSGIIALDAFFKFSRIGYNCYYNPDSHINAIALSNPMDGDVYMCISHSGESQDVIKPIENLPSHIKIISITGNEKSTLGKLSDVCIEILSEEKNYRTDAMVSRIVRIALNDILFVGLCLRQGINVKEKLLMAKKALSYLKT